MHIEQVTIQHQDAVRSEPTYTVGWTRSVKPELVKISSILAYNAAETYTLARLLLGCVLRYANCGRVYLKRSGQPLDGITELRMESQRAQEVAPY